MIYKCINQKLIYSYFTRGPRPVFPVISTKICNGIFGDICLDARVKINV